MVNKTIKQICWIDDSPKLMINVARNIFIKLWEHRIDSKIIFFGDNYKKDKEMEPSLDDEYYSDFKDSLYYLSSSFQKQNPVEPFIPNIENVVSIPDPIITNIIDVWKEISSESDINYYNSQTSALIEYITSTYTDISCYGIDLTLLSDDVKRVKNRCLPIISMPLFHYFRKREIPCFIFSTYTYDVEYIKMWKEVYRNNYPEDNISDLNIYNRNNLMYGNNNITVDTIVSMIESSLQGEH